VANSSKRVSKKVRGVVYSAVGLDVSDRKSHWVGLDDAGKETGRGKVASRSVELEAWAMSIAPTLIALEAGPNPRWMGRPPPRGGGTVRARWRPRCVSRRDGGGGPWPPTPRRPPR